MNELVLGYLNMGTGRVEPFDQVFGKALLLNPMRDEAAFSKIDCLVVWGGADISPSLYNEPVSERCHATSTPSRGDTVEWKAMQLAIQYGKPIIGICRGAQMACAAAGGKLIQHVDHHAGYNHDIITKDGRTISTSSVHHQMMYPWDVEHDMIAWSDTIRSQVHIMGDESSIDVPCEPEIVYFPKIKALAIQGHPEFMSSSCEFVQYCNDLVQSYLLTENENA